MFKTPRHRQKVTTDSVPGAALCGCADCCGLLVVFLPPGRDVLALIMLSAITCGCSFCTPSYPDHGLKSMLRIVVPPGRKEVERLGIEPKG
ncbi:MAG: hypothetical protein AB1423_00780 [Pseudomonadota bacterium]